MRAHGRMWTVLLVAALFLSAVCIVLHLFVSLGPLGDLTYLVPVFLAPVIGLVGTLRHAPGERLVPAILTTGLAASALGDLIWMAYYWSGTEPDVSWADPVYVGSYVGIAGALLAMTMVRRDDRLRIDPGAVIDALTVVVVSVLLLWSISVHDIVADTTVPVFTRLVWAIYPIADAVVLALAIRVLTQRRTRQALGIPFTIGVISWLAADLGYYVLEFTDTISALLDVGWMLGGVLMAVATLRPQLVPAPETPEEIAARSPMRTLGIAIIPLLVPPAILLATELIGEKTHAIEAVVGMGTLALLTYARTARLLRSEHDARKAALEGSRAKSAFLATMSHEIRTPMNGVIGLTSLLLETELDTRQRQYAEGVRTAGSSLLTIINDILDFSKVEAGHLQLEEIDFDLVHVIEEAAEVVAEPAQEKNLELVAYCSPRLPVALRGDPSRIRQVLINLAGNAVKFTASGEVVIHADLDSTTQDGLVVRFEVTDSGIGIAGADRERLFEPFSQADSSTTRRYGGTGLGLAICAQLVTAMGGTLGVDSTPGEGSTFWFTLPLAPARDDTVATPRRTEPLAGLSVLVVDDNATNRMILEDQLTAWGMVVTAAASAPEALRLALEAARRDQAFDLAIVDMCMPDMDGLELARRFSADPDLTGTGLALLTSVPDVSAADTATAGIAATMTKPVHLSRLHTTLQDIVGARPDGAARPAAASPDADRGVVLVVEDVEINQIVATGMLEHLGYRVDVVDDGLAALAAVGRTAYDVVFMDVEMPGMDGYQATAEIRLLEGEGRHTPIVAMTAGATEDYRTACRAAGMDDYLTKPISVEALTEVLGRWVPAR